MRAALSAVDARWSVFAVVSKTMYLGCIVGLGAEPEDARAAPAANALDREASLAGKWAPRSTLVPLSNERVLTD